MIEQENVPYISKLDGKPSSIGKHTRASHLDADSEPGGILGPWNKRRALGQITNQSFRKTGPIGDGLCKPDPVAIRASVQVSLIRIYNISFVA